MGDRSRMTRSRDVDLQSITNVEHSRNDVTKRIFQETNSKRESLPKYAADTMINFARERLSENFQGQNKDLKVNTDKNGKFYINDEVREFSFDINSLKEIDPLGHAKLEQEIKKHALSENLGIDKENLNRLKINNGVYSFTDRQGTKYEISRENPSGATDNFDKSPVTDETRDAFDKTRKDVEAKITTLGFKVDSMPMPDPVEKDFLKRVASKETDLASKTAIENGAIYNYRYDSNTDHLALNIIPRVEHENGSGAKEIKDGEMKEFSIDLKTLLPEEKTILIDQVKNHFVEEQIKKDIEGTGGKFVDGSLTIEGDKYSYENQDVVLKGKLHGEQKEDLEKYLSSLGLGDKKALVSEAEAKLHTNDSPNTPEVTNQAKTETGESNQEESDKVQRLVAEKEKFDRKHKRNNNFLMGLRVVNDSALQNSQTLEAAVIDKLLQTEDAGSQQMPPGSMFSQGLVDRHHEHGRRQSKVKQKAIEIAKDEQEQKNKIKEQRKALGDITNQINTKQNSDLHEKNHNLHGNSTEHLENRE